MRNPQAPDIMKNPAMNHFYFKISLLILSLMAVDKVSSDLDKFYTPPQDIQMSDQFYNQSIIVKVPDKDSINSVTLRIRCSDSLALQELSHSMWQLITMKDKDSGTEPSNSDYDPSWIPPIPINARIQIELITKEIQEDIIAYYIERKQLVANSKTEIQSSFVETEFISPYETFGGFIQIFQSNPDFEIPIWVHAQALDDPSTEPKTVWITSPLQNQFITIDFNDKKDMLHTWSVLIRHDLSTFPIVCWTRETRLP